MDPCPYNCKHCYTFGLNEENNNLTAENIFDSLAGKSFEVIYVLHNKANFIGLSNGIDLCRKLYRRYDKDMLIITRNVFNEEELNDFSMLNEEMKKMENCYV